MKSRGKINISLEGSKEERFELRHSKESAYTAEVDTGLRMSVGQIKSIEQPFLAVIPRAANTAAWINAEYNVAKQRNRVIEGEGEGEEEERRNTNTLLSRGPFALHF